MKRIRILSFILTAVILASTCHMTYAVSKERQGRTQKWMAKVSETMPEQKLVVGIDEIANSLDPALNEDESAGHLINNMFEGLMREVNGAIKPAAAKSYSVSEDGKTYTFTIREDAKWSDGKAVTAYDFEYAWDRVSNPQTGSPYGWLFDSAQIFRWRAVDKSTFEVVLYEPAPYFIGMTAFYTFFPVREDIVEYTTYADWTAIPALAVSNGPFRLKDYQYVEKFTFEANPYYWNKEAVKLDTIEWCIDGDRYKLLNNYNKGQLDIIEDLAIDQIPNLIKNEPTLQITPKDGVYYYIFNTDIKPLNDVRVRKALSLAIDRSFITDHVIKLGQIPSHSVIPGNFLDSEGRVFNQVSGTYGIADTAKIKEAKALLAEAGYPNGRGLETFEFTYNNSYANKAIAEAVQKMWKENLGVEVVLVSQEWEDFQELKANHDFQICRGGWVGDYSDPITYLELFKSDFYLNDSNWKNEVFDKLLDRSKTLPPKERFRKLYAADKVLGENYVTIPILNYTDLVLANDRVAHWEETSRSLFYFGQTEILGAK